MNMRDSACLDRVSGLPRRKGSGICLILATHARLLSDDNDLVRLKELMLWAPMAEGSPKLLTGATAARAMVDSPRHYVFVNQCGYNAGWPKRFTAPQSPDGTKFIVTASGDAKALFEGTIIGGTGDFSAFEPVDARDEFVVRLSGGGLTEAVSDPFAIQPRLLQKLALGNGVRFMQDARSVVGTHPSAYGGRRGVSRLDVLHIRDAVAGADVPVGPGLLRQAAC